MIARPEQYITEAFAPMESARTLTRRLHWHDRQASLLRHELMRRMLARALWRPEVS